MRTRFAIRHIPVRARDQSAGAVRDLAPGILVRTRKPPAGIVIQEAVFQPARRTGPIENVAHRVRSKRPVPETPAVVRQPAPVIEHVADRLVHLQAKEPGIGIEQAGIKVVRAIRRAAAQAVDDKRLAGVFDNAEQLALPPRHLIESRRVVAPRGMDEAHAGMRSHQPRLDPSSTVPKIGMFIINDL